MDGYPSLLGLISSLKASAFCCILLYVKRLRSIFEKANDCCEVAFRVNVAKIVLKRLNKKPARPLRFNGEKNLRF